MPYRGPCSTIIPTCLVVNIAVHLIFITFQRPGQLKVSCCCPGKLGGPVLVSAAAFMMIHLDFAGILRCVPEGSFALLTFDLSTFKVCSFAPSPPHYDDDHLDQLQRGVAAVQAS